ATTPFAFSSRIASTDRSRAAPTRNARPARVTSSGPNTRNSINAPDDRSTVVGERLVRPSRFPGHGTTAIDRQPLSHPETGRRAPRGLAAAAPEGQGRHVHHARDRPHSYYLDPRRGPPLLPAGRAGARRGACRDDRGDRLPGRPHDSHGDPLRSDDRQRRLLPACGPLLDPPIAAPCSDGVPPPKPA